MEDLMPQPIEQIPNNSLNNEKTNDITKTEDIYIDDSLKNISFFRLHQLMIEKILK